MLRLSLNLSFFNFNFNFSVALCIYQAVSLVRRLLDCCSVLLTTRSISQEKKKERKNNSDLPYIDCHAVRRYACRLDLGVTCKCHGGFVAAMGTPGIPNCSCSRWMEFISGKQLVPRRKLDVLQ